MLVRLLTAILLIYVSTLLITSLPIIGKPVFKGLNQTQKVQLHSILFNTNATRGAIKKGVADWVESQKNQTIKDAYEKHQNQKEEWKKLFMEVHNERIAKLSNDAKDLDGKLMAVWRNDSLTIKQTCQQINQLISTAPDFVAKELFREIRKCTAGDPDNFEKQFY